MTSIAPEATFSDSALADIAEAVATARGVILELIKSQPGATWRPRQLIDAAKDAINEPKISKTIVSIAFWNMVEDDELAVDEQLIVRAAHLAQDA